MSMQVFKSITDYRVVCKRGRGRVKAVTDRDSERVRATVLNYDSLQAASISLVNDVSPPKYRPSWNLRLRAHAVPFMQNQITAQKLSHLLVLVRTQLATFPKFAYTLSE